MKLFLVLSFISVALATPATHPVPSEPTPTGVNAKKAYQQLQHQPFIAIPNNEYTGVAGYYVSVPYDIYISLATVSSNYAQQFFNELQQYGYLPIYNYLGSLAGFYVQNLGTASNKPVTQEPTYYIKNFGRYGLRPILNQQNQVTGLYFSYPQAPQYPNDSLPSGYNYFSSYGTTAPQYPSHYQYQQQSGHANQYQYQTPVVPSPTGLF